MYDGQQANQMKALSKILSNNRYFLIFVLVFAYAQSIYGRILVRRDINLYTFTPEAAVATLFSVSLLFGIVYFYIRRFQKSALFTSAELVKISVLSLLSYILIIHVTGLLISLTFDTVERNFGPKMLLLSIVSSLIDSFIYGSFFLAYFYYKKNKSFQKQLASYTKTLHDSKISQLKTQLNPHFLFNNLNVLDQLIEENKDKASAFLNEFADIYRYVLQGSDKKLVSLEQELDFAKQYFKLIQYKYGTAYQLSISVNEPIGFIVPLTLQLLVENAIQHNLGRENKPVKIEIEIGRKLRITNNLIEKKHHKPTSGRALQNLEEQYKLLTNESIVIQKTDDRFTVLIPLIQKEVI